VTLHVLPTLAPLDDSITAFQNVALTIDAPGVLANDTADYGSGLTAALVTGPAHGALTLNTDGSLLYTPAAGYLGTDNFTYQATDALNANGNATVTLDVIEDQDIAIGRFYSDGTDLKIDYAVLGDAVGPFSIAVHASADGTSLDEPLATAAADNTPGTHTLTIAPTFDDPQYDYYLVAQVDANAEIPEVYEDNNQALFAGGAFIDHEASSGLTVLQVHGTDSDDSLSVAATSDDAWHVTLPSRCRPAVRRPPITT
jgi:hypothetical protein